MLLTQLINLNLYDFRGCNAVLLSLLSHHPNLLFFLVVFSQQAIYKLCSFWESNVVPASTQQPCFQRNILFPVVGNEKNFSRDGFSQILSLNKTQWVILWPLLPGYNSHWIHCFCLRAGLGINPQCLYWESVLRSARRAQRVMETLALSKAFKPGVPARGS